MNTLIKASKKIMLDSSSDVIESNGSKKSDVKINIAPQIFHNPLIIYSTISVIHAEIPVSFYIINEYNDSIILNGVEYKFTHGNYDSNSFMSMFHSLINDFVLNFNRNTGVFSLSYISNFTLTGTSGVLLGYDNNVLYTSVDNTIIMEKPANFLGTKNIKISSPNIRTENYDNGTKQDFLLNLQQNQAPYGLILYNNINGFNNVFLLEFLNFVHIQIRDDWNNLINFNSIDWSITLQIDSYYYKLPKKYLLDSINEKEKSNDKK